MLALASGGSLFGGSTFTKTNSGTSGSNFTAAGAWTSGTTPTAAANSTDILRWDSTVTTSQNIGAGSASGFGELQIANPGGTIEVNNTTALLLTGVQTGGTGPFVSIDMSQATQDLYLQAAVTLGIGNVGAGNSQTWILGGNRTLTIGGALTQTAGLTITGAGNLLSNQTVTLAGNDTYTGTTVWTGGTLTLSSLTGGTLSGTSGVYLSGGTLADGDTNSVNNRINSNASLNLGGANGIGTFNMVRPTTGTNTQTFSGIFNNVGVNVIGNTGSGGSTNVTFNGAAGGGYVRSQGGFINFTSGNGNQTVTFNNAPTAAGGSSVVGTGATAMLVGAVTNQGTAATTDFVQAFQSTPGTPYTLGSPLANGFYTSVATGNTAVLASGENLNITGATGTVAASGTTLQSIRENASGNVVLTLDSGTTTLQSGGILVAGTTGNTLSINSNATLPSNLQAASGQDIWVVTGSGENAAINANIIDNNGSGLEKFGAGTLALGGANSFMGQVDLSGGGFLTLGTTTALGSSTTTANLNVENGGIGINFSSGFGAGNTLTTVRNIVLSPGANLSVDTTNGTLNLAGTITASGNGAGGATLTKTGTGTLIISGNGGAPSSSTPIGLQVNGGTLEISGSLMDNGGNLSGGASTNPAVIQLDAGGVWYNANDTSIGTNANNVLNININGGIAAVTTRFFFGKANNESTTINQTGGTLLAPLVVIGNQGAATTVGTTYNLTGGTLLLSNSGAISVIDSDSVLHVDGGTIRVNNNDFLNSQNTAAAATTPGVAGFVSLTGAGATVDVTGANTFTMSTPVSGAGGLTKTDTGTLVLAATDTYSGTTKVNGGTLRFDANAYATNGTSNTISNTMGALALGGGSTLALNGRGNGAALSTTENNAASVGTSTITLASTTGLVVGQMISGGGLPANTYITNINGTSITLSTSITVAIPTGTALTVTSTTGATTSLTFGGTTVNAGGNTVTVTSNGSGTLLNLGAITRNTGGTVNFSNITTTQSSTNGYATSTGNTSGILGGYAVYNGTDWATNNGTNIVALASGSYVNDTWASGNNTTSTLANLTLGSNATTNSLRFNGANANDTITLTGNNVIQSGGILVTAATGIGQSLIASTTQATDTLTSGTSDLVIQQYNTTTPFYIQSVIANNGATPISLTKAGPGALLVDAANTYSGTTYLDGGLLIVGGTETAGVSGPMGAGGNITFDGGTLQYEFTGGPPLFDYSSRIKNSLGAVAIDTNGQSLTFGSAIDASNTGGFTKAGSGTLTLSGANTFTGTVNLNVGTLQAGIDSTATTGALGVGNAVTMAASTTLDLNGHSVAIGSLTGTAASSVVTLNGGTLTTGSDNTNTTFAGLIAGNGSVVKNGVGTWTLSGANTYTGSTFLNGGLIVVGAVPTFSGPTLVSSALGVNTALTIGNATLNMNGVNTVVGSLASAANTSGGDVLLGWGTLTTGGNNISTTYAGAINGIGGLVKNGTGTMALTGINNYSGSTTINGGRILANNGVGSLGTGAVIVASGAGLGGTGVVTNSNITIAAGGMLLAGDGTSGSLGAVLTVDTPSVSVTGGIGTGSSILEFVLGAANAHSSLNLVDTTFTITPTSGSSLLRIQLDGSIQQGVYTGLITGLSAAIGSQASSWSIVDSSGNAIAGTSLTFDSTSDSLSLTVAPEPGTWALLAGGGLFLALLRFRRRDILLS